MPDITPEELRTTAAACRLMGGAHACAAADMERAADTIERQSARIAELEQQVAALQGHANWLKSVIDDVALAAHGWTEETRQAYVPAMLFQTVASLRADAERWGYMRTSGVVLVIHDVPYRGSDLDAAVDTEIVKLRERANGDGVRER